MTLAKLKSSKVMRIKTRNCYRENTFRYFFEKSDFLNIWNIVESNYGRATEFGSPNLLQITTKAFIIRSSISDASLTIIKSPYCLESDIERFHNLISFTEDLNGKNI